MDASHIGPPPLPEFSEPSSAAAAESAAHKGTGAVKAFDDKGGPSFSDLLDIINPLQHIPVINTLYQKLTGDTEGAVADVVGGALWGGVIGLGCAVANLVVQDSTGDTLGGHVLAMFEDDKPAPTATATVEKPTVIPTPPSAVVVQQASLPAAAGPQASLDAPVPKAAPRDTVSAKTLASPSAAAAAVSVTPTVPDGPMRAGDFLIFGGTVTTPAAASKTPVAADTDGKTNDFMVFGGLGSKPATSLPLPLPGTAVATAEQSAEPTPTPAPTAAPTLTGSANPASGNGLKMPVVRNSMPPAHLGLPTTGPAAVPGHQGESQAKGNNDWIVGTMAVNMDKYQKAAKLGTASDDAAGKDGTGEKPAIAPPTPVDGN